MTLTAPPDAAAPRTAGGSGILEIRHVSKAFPNVQALDDVSLDVRPGEVLAFMGENGAGKSTLLKILNGDYQPDAGTLTLDGEALSFADPRDARAAGIRVIYQEPEIIPGVDVAENIFAGELPAAARLRRPPPAQRAACDRDLARLRLRDASCRAPAWATSSRRPSASSSRSCGRSSRGIRVLALDEPTSSLTDEEVDRLFTLVRRLRDEGVAIIYVSTACTRSCSSPTASPSCATAGSSRSPTPRT